MNVSIVCSAFAASIFIVSTSIAYAGHEHYIDTPGTLKDDIGKGQTSISDPDHGGYHRFHNNVHLGTPGAGETPSGTQSNVGTTVESNPVTIGKSSDLE